jgi:hypothetical protein
MGVTLVGVKVPVAKVPGRVRRSLAATEHWASQPAPDGPFLLEPLRVVKLPAEQAQWPCLAAWDGIYARPWSDGDVPSQVS